MLWPFAWLIIELTYVKHLSIHIKKHEVDQMEMRFMGLGNMGQSVVCNIFISGYSVTVYNRIQSSSEETKADERLGDCRRYTN